MRDELPEDAVVVVTADHGHLDYTESGRIQFEQNDPLRTLLVDSPSGDERAVMFHVVEGMKDRFVSEFSSRFSENFMLLETRKVIELGLLGPDGVSDLAVGRLGDFLAISKNDTGMSFRDRPSTSGFTLVSQHGGLHPDEMLVPVIIA
jgi:hypothetical protein